MSESGVLVRDEPLPDSLMPSIVDALVAPDHTVAVLASVVAPGGDAVAAMAAVDLGRLSHPGRVDALVVLQRQIAWLQARQTRLLALMATDPRPAADAVDPSGKNWVREDVACALRLPAGTAAAVLAEAEQLHARLPDTLACLESGQITGRHAAVIAEATSHLDPATAARVQARVLARAARQTVPQLRASVRRAVLAADPRTAEDRHADAVTERRVVLTPSTDGMAELWALLPADGAQAVLTAVQALADRTDPDRPPHRRPAPRRRAGRTRLPRTHRPMHRPTRPAGAAGRDPRAAGRALPRRHRMRPTVQVTVALSTLLGLDTQPGELAGHGPIPAALALRIAADPTGTWRRLITDDHGRLIDRCRNRYRPPRDLTDHIITRDPTCRFPGCRRAARRCDIDHLHPYQTGGTTETCNLQCLCPRHHHAKHDAGWTITGNPNGTLTWTSPTGHHYHNRPRRTPHRPHHKPEPRPNPDHRPESERPTRHRV